MSKRVKIESQGYTYEITSEGLVTEQLRRHYQKNDSNRPGFDEQPDPEQVRICEDWLATFGKPRKTFNRQSYSYSLKHTVERWAGRYVTNGAFLLAAHRAGYKIQPESPLGLNGLINISFTRKAGGSER